MGTMRSAQSAKSAAEGDVSARRASRKAAAAEAALCRAAAAVTASESARWKRVDRAAAGMAPNEKADLSAA
eukprot:3378600-Pleurochrysis_carterae.AAC.1